MRTKIVDLTGDNRQVNRALLLAEKFADYQGLSQKNVMEMRLLSEELLGMVRSITGTEEGHFWIEEEDNVYQIHLQVTTDMDFDKRENLLSASSSGKNEAARGFMGRLHALFDRIDDAGVPTYFPTDVRAGNVSWSMNSYKQMLRAEVANQKAGSAQMWDELEKSVIFHIADDVKVSIRGPEVEVVIYKKMRKDPRRKKPVEQ